MSATMDKANPASGVSENGNEHSQEREWLTAAEAAAYAGGVGVCTIREACNRNTLRHIRIGGGIAGPIRTRREWIADWLGRWERGGDVH